MKIVVPDMKGRRRLARFERAAIAQAFIDSCRPDDRPKIKREYTQAKTMMLKHLDEQALTIVDLNERVEA